MPDIPRTGANPSQPQRLSRAEQAESTTGAATASTEKAPGQDRHVPIRLPKANTPVIPKETAAARSERLSGLIDAQAARLADTLQKNGVDPTKSRIAFIVDALDAHKSGTADATAIALGVARKLGLTLDVITSDGVRLSGPGVDADMVLDRLSALTHGPAGAQQAATTAWLREVQGPRRMGGPAGGTGAMSTAHQMLRRNQKADEHDAVLQVRTSASSPAQLSMVESSWKHDGIAVHGVNVGAAASQRDRQLAGVSVKPDADALRNAVGSELATALLTSLSNKLEEHIAELTQHKADTETMIRETNRVVADAWFATSTQEFVQHATQVNERLVSSYRHDPLVFDLSGKGTSGLELVDLRRGDGLLLDRTVERHQTAEDLGETHRAGVGRRVNVFARTQITTTTITRETRFSQWVGKNTGVLVMDRGQGYDKTALFGDSTTTGRKAAHGFDDLAKLDANNDGVVDKKDPGFASLKIWRDLNGNGKVDPGELMSLKDAGIAEIKVGSRATGDEVFAQQGTWASTKGVALREQVAAAPEQLKRSSDVGLVLRDTAGTSFHVVGGYLAGPKELAAEIEKQKKALAVVQREIAKLSGQ